jgi:hypothetical protein
MRELVGCDCEGKVGGEMLVQEGYHASYSRAMWRQKYGEFECVGVLCYIASLLPSVLTLVPVKAGQSFENLEQIFVRNHNSAWACLPQKCATSKLDDPR